MILIPLKLGFFFKPVRLNNFITIIVNFKNMFGLPTVILSNLSSDKSRACLHKVGTTNANKLNFLLIELWFLEGS